LPDQLQLRGYPTNTGATPPGFVSSAPPVIGNADTITESLYPEKKVNNKATQAIRDLIKSAATTGIIPDYTGKCSAPSQASIGKQIGVTSAATITSNLLGAIPLVGQTLSKFTGLITGLFTHHGQAVALETDTLCVAVPDANNALRQIDQAVAGGLDHDSAMAALNQGFTAWRQEVSAILKDTGGKCNAACVFELAFKAAIMKRQIDYSQASYTQDVGSRGFGSGVVSAVKQGAKSVLGGVQESGLLQSFNVSFANIPVWAWGLGLVVSVGLAVYFARRKKP